MYLVIIAWLYVAVLMAVAEAMSHNGTLLGAIVTFFLYGLMPIALVVYLMGTPLRRKARAKQEDQVPTTGGPLLAEPSGRPSDTPDAGRESTSSAETGGITAVRKQP